MEITIETKYTPASIAASQTAFSIPLYQRLFEWEQLQITQLLNDLYGAFIKNSNEPYYIGMLTVHNKDLVDGQQRFTVLMLMAIAFKWDKFLKVDNSSGITASAVEIIRLSFFAREKDRSYLLKKINNEPKIPTDYKNAKMELGINCIADFVDMLEDKKEYIDYIYNHLTFFISELPKEYEPQDLNKYFEAMNADGRGLQNHEILKVNLLKQLSGDKEFYAKIWNAVADMDKLLIRPKYINKIQEDKSKLNERQRLALQNITNTPNSFNYCNDLTKSTESLSEYLTIREISAKNDTRKTNIRSIGERAILNFPEFLLQVLYLQQKELGKEATSDFFNVHKLQETFKRNLQPDSVETFFQNLLKYRLIFDYTIIRVSSQEENTTTYTLVYKEDDINILDLEKLIKYQSMLYVSTSSNIWLTEILGFLGQNQITVSIESFYNKLVEFDNDRRRKVTNLSLKYRDIDRYWFWRLDYYLWKNREIYFSGNAALDVSKNYVFRTNRSIEHISPQTPEENSAINLDKETVLDWFGNLAMISSGQNSSLKNRSYEVKKAYVNSFINKSKNGSIESLKLLKVLDYETWNEAKVKDHGNEMIDIIIDSFPNEGYDDIKSLLSKSKLI